MRVTTAFNRVLSLPGAWVEWVSFTDVGIVIGLRRQGRPSRAMIHLCLGGITINLPTER